MNELEFAELAAGYALNALSPEDRAAFENALALHPEWAHRVQTDAATAATLAEAAPFVAPPYTMRSSLLLQIATLPQESADRSEQDHEHEATPIADALAAQPPAAQPPSATVAEKPSLPPLPEPAPFVDAPPMPSLPGSAEPEPDAGPVNGPGPYTEMFAAIEDTRPVEPAPTTSSIQGIARRNWTRGLFTLAASLVLLVVLGFGAANLNQWIGRPPAVIALQEIEAAPDAESATVAIEEGGGIATAHWSGSLGKAVLVTDGLPAIASGETFELWFVREDGTPVSAGTFDASRATTTALLTGTMHAGDTIAVTVEEAGGSPTGEPTTDPIVAIPTA